jgi:DNA-binding transcriptional ArsR family regulator
VAATSDILTPSIRLPRSVVIGLLHRLSEATWPFAHQVLAFSHLNTAYPTAPEFSFDVFTRSGQARLMYNYMVVHTPNQQRADRLFHALADTTRRDILRRSLQGENSVSTLASYYPMSFAAVQKHVAVLEKAELVTKERRGREQMVRGDVVAVHYAFELLEQFEAVWRSRLGRFSEILADNLREEAT